MNDMKRAVLICLAGLTGLAMTACGGGGETPVDAATPRDAYTPPPEDTGPPQDTGPPVDAFVPTDAGGPATSVRLAHFIPGAPNVHVCLFLLAGGMERGGGPPVTVTSPPGIPYRGISGYVTFPSDVASDHRVKVFAAEDIDLSDAMPCGEATATPLITADIPGGTLESGTAYTVAAVGLPDGTAGSPQAPHLLIEADDRTAPAAGMVRVRLFHAIPNLGALGVTAVDVCHDPDGPGAMPAVEVFSEVAYEDVTDYLEAMPITTGSITVHAFNAAAPECNMTPATSGGTLLLGTALPFPVTPRPAGAEALRETFAATEIDTAFAVGDVRFSVPAGVTCTAGGTECAMLGAGGTASPAGTICHPTLSVCVNGLAPTVIPWQDNFMP